MKKYTNEEIRLINSLNKPIYNIDMNLVNLIVDKMLKNHEYFNLLCFLNNLYDFAELPESIVDKLIMENNKECIAEFLENENILYFLNPEDKKRLKDYLNVQEINIKLENTYDYYYKLLYKQGIRNWHCDTQNNDDIIVHTFTRYNKLINLKLKEIKEVGVVVSCIIYSNYYLSKDEQILKGIDYINEFGFNIERDINNKSIISSKY